MAESVLITDQQSNVECNSKYIYGANERLYNCVCSLSPARVVAGSISNHNIYRPSFKTSVFTARFSCHGCRTMGCFWPLTHEWVLQKRIIIPSFIHLNVSDSILPLRPESWCGSKSNCSSVIMIRERGCLLQLTAFPPPLIRSWYFHRSTDQRCPETTRVTSNSVFCFFASQFVSSDFVSRAECRDWSWHMFHSEPSIQNSRHIICRNTPAMTEAAKWTQKKKIKIKRHTQVSERDRAVLFISLKLLSTRSCFRSTMLQLTHRHKHHCKWISQLLFLRHWTQTPGWVFLLCLELIGCFPSIWPRSVPVYVLYITENTICESRCAPPDTPSLETAQKK